MLADLGVSSMQLDAPGRGFSFRRDEPLDMRMDRRAARRRPRCWRVVDERTLADVIYEFGEERHARAWRGRSSKPVATRADRDDRAAGRDRAAGDPAARLHAHRPGDADVPGDPHLGEPRARRAGRLSRARGRRLAPGGRLVVIDVSLARGPHREAHVARAADERARISVRTKRSRWCRARRRSTATPRARSAKLRAAERLAVTVRSMT